MSPTSSVHNHFKREHCCKWHDECARLGILPNHGTEWAPDPDMEMFAQEGFIAWLLKFIVSDDQVCHQLLSVCSTLTH